MNQLQQILRKYLRYQSQTMHPSNYFYCQICARNQRRQNHIHHNPLPPHYLPPHPLPPRQVLPVRFSYGQRRQEVSENINAGRPNIGSRPDVTRPENSRSNIDRSANLGRPNFDRSNSDRPANLNRPPNIDRPPNLGSPNNSDPDILPALLNNGEVIQIHERMDAEQNSPYRDYAVTVPNNQQENIEGQGDDDGDEYSDSQNNEDNQMNQPNNDGGQLQFLRKQLKITRQNLQQKQQIIRFSRQTIQNIKDQLRQIQQSRQSCESQKKQLKQKNKKLEKQLNEITKRYQQLTKQLKKDEPQIYANLEKQLKLKEERIQELLQQIEVISNKNKSLEELLNSEEPKVPKQPKSTNNNSLAEKYKQATLQLLRKQKKIEKLHQKQTDCKRQLFQLKQRVRELEEENISLMKAKNTFEELYKQYKKQCQLKAIRIRQLENIPQFSMENDDRLQQLIDLIKKKEQIIARLKRQNQKLKKKLGQIQDNYVSQKQLKVLHDFVEEYHKQILAKGGSIYDPLSNEVINYFNQNVFENTLIYELKKDNLKLLQILNKNGSYRNDSGVRSSPLIHEQNFPPNIGMDAIKAINKMIEQLITKFDRFKTNPQNQNGRSQQNLNNRKDKKKPIKTQRNNSQRKLLYNQFTNDYTMCRLHLDQLYQYLRKLIKTHIQVDKQIFAGGVQNLMQAFRQSAKQQHKADKKDIEQNDIVDNSQLQLDIKKLQSENQELHRQISKLISDKEQFMRKRSQQQIKIQRQNQRNNQDLKQKQQYISNAHYLQIRCQELVNNINEMKQQKRKIQKDIKILNRTNNDKEDLNQRLQEDNKVLSRSNRDYLDRLDRSGEEIFRLQNQLSGLRYLLKQYQNKQAYQAL